MTSFKYRKFLSRTLVALFLPGMSAIAAENNDKTVLQSSVINVEQGLVKGLRENGVSRYLGMPYAKPPLGELRWRPPQDAASWEGIRESNEFGNACSQIGNFYTTNNLSDFDRPYGHEDCLYLNVWTPQKIIKKRPVIVFIHGGSGVVGAASLPLYNGQLLAKELNAVFVSINYRLGYLGNIYIPALQQGDPAGDSGSFALLDQVKALEWVQNNINKFGGDGSNVTLMGHSAGCASIWALMRTPLATGTFQKSICMSGLPVESSKEEMTEASEKVLSRLLVTDGLIKSSEDLQHYIESTTASQRRDYLYGKSAIEITNASRGIGIAGGGVDGHVITAGKNGPLVNPVPTIIGTTDDEAPLLLLRRFSHKNVTDIWGFIHSDKPLTQTSFFDSLLDFAKFKITVWVADLKLMGMIEDSLLLLKSSSVPVYRYRFEWKNTPEPWQSLLGAYHGIDVPFVFGNFELNSQSFTDFTWGTSEELAREKIHTQFTNVLRGFIESTDPNKYATDLDWSLWDGDDSETIIN